MRKRQIGDAGAETLKGNAALSELWIEGNEISDAGAQALAEALKVNTTVTELNLTSNQIGGAGARALASL